MKKMLIKNSKPFLRFFQKISLLQSPRVSLHTIKVNELILKEYNNEVEKAIELKSYELDQDSESLRPDELFVKLIAAPINPADINIIQGRYGILPKTLPSKMGNEGLFEVVRVHENNSKFRKGDWLLPTGSFPCWQSHSVANESQFYRLPNNLDKRFCATLKVNPVTAYRMLINFRELKPNDTVIQNGANSAVGQAVIQLGKVMNLNIINIVRKRTNQEELNQQLKDLGAKYIFTEEELRSSKYLTNDLWKEIPRPRFALNCVGGKATTDLVRLLDKESIMVTYGGMSKQPLSFNTADFIFKNFQSFGFWLTSWRDKHKNEFEKSISFLCDLAAKGQFKPPKCEEFKLENYNEAFKRVQTPLVTSKILFIN